MTTDPGSGATLRAHARLVMRRKWWVAGLALLGLAAGLAASLLQARQYSATAQVLVQSATSPGSPAADAQQVTQTEVQTMVQLVTSASVVTAVRHELGTAPPVTASEVAQTNVVNITAVAATPGVAARVANVYARQFLATQQRASQLSATTAEGQLKAQIQSTVAQVRKLRADGNSTSELTSLVNQEAVLRVQLSQLEVSGASSALALVTPAAAPTAPSAPKPLQDELLGLITGLILGLAAAFLRDSLDDTVSSRETAELLIGAPVLAAVPTVSSWRKRDRPLVVALARPASPATEAYRSLRVSLEFARQDNDLCTILVTSPAAAEGKTSTLANLGAVFAQSGQRVLMVSGDLRKPKLGEFFGIDERAGLTTAILGEQPVDSLIVRAPGTESLWLLPSGPTPPSPAELLNGPRAQQIFARLRGTFDLVLIDSPPILTVTDALVLSKDVDATLLVVAAYRTRAGDLQRATQKLAQVDATVVGAVLNEATRQGSGYYGSYGGRHGTYARPETAPQVPSATMPGPVASYTVHLNGSPVNGSHGSGSAASGPDGPGDPPGPDHRRPREHD